MQSATGGEGPSFPEQDGDEDGVLDAIGPDERTLEPPSVVPARSLISGERSSTAATPWPYCGLAANPVVLIIGAHVSPPARSRRGSSLETMALDQSLSAALIALKTTEAYYYTISLRRSSSSSVTTPDIPRDWASANAEIIIFLAFSLLDLSGHRRSIRACQS